MNDANKSVKKIRLFDTNVSENVFIWEAWNMWDLPPSSLFPFASVIPIAFTPSYEYTNFTKDA